MQCHVLVVESDPRVREILAKGLGRLGHRVVVGIHGDALGAVATRPFDCLVIRHEPPGVDGVKLVRQIRELNQKVGVVLLAHDPEPVMEMVEGLSVWAVCQGEAPTDCLAAKVEEASSLARMSPEAEEQLAAGFATESKAMRRVHQDLLNETHYDMPLPKEGE